MSCTELGLTEYGLRVSKSADCEEIGRAPASTDLTGYTGELVIRADETSAALLTVTETPTGNDSVLVFADNLVTFRIKKADIQTLPDNADDENLPWEGVCELVVVSTSGLRSRVFFLPIIVEQGAAR